MMSRWQDWPPQVLASLREGVVIPAHPLALDRDRKFDARRQRALTRYYLDAGARGLAVGVHTTQFAIREAGLFAPVLELAMRSAAEWAREAPIMIAGLTGRTVQAVKEARVARGLGYHAGLLSLAALKGGASEDELIAHAQTVAREIPLVGFYLQPAVGGLVLPVSFWRRFAANEVPAGLLALDAQVTDCNAAIFDAANDFHGVIAGCHEILRRQGLLEGIWCLDPAESLGLGQSEEIDRVCAAYPHLNDDAFVRANLQRWLS